MDLKLDLTTNDLLFVNGECPITSSDFDVVAQRLSIRLKTCLGEYNFNTEYGVPYFQSILGQRVRKQDVDNIMQQQIYKEEGVVQLKEFNSALENFEYGMSFRAENDKGLLSDPININISL